MPVNYCPKCTENGEKWSEIISYGKGVKCSVCDWKAEKPKYGGTPPPRKLLPDPRDSKIYKLILKQQKELEKQVCSDRRFIKDLLVFNYTSERKAEIVKEHLEKIEAVFKSHRKEINSFDVGKIW